MGRSSVTVSFPLLLLSPRFSDDSRAVRAAALDAGWDVIRPPTWRLPQEVVSEAARREMVPYGESLFCTWVASELDLALLATPHDFLARLPRAFLRRQVSYMTLAEAIALEERAFFKPAEDKWFRAGIYASGRELPGVEGLPGADPVLVSEPVTFGVEYRCFVLQGTVATCGIYLRHGELAVHEPPTPAEEDEATAFARSVLDAVDTPPAFVLDVGYVEDRGWAVVEANPAWASGVYGCAASAILPVLRRAARPHHALSDVDRRWLPPRPAIEG